MPEPVRIVLLQLVVRPLWVAVGPDGRPLETQAAAEQWVVPYEQIEGLKARVEQEEAALTAKANGTGGGGLKQPRR